MKNSNLQQNLSRQEQYKLWGEQIFGNYLKNKEKTSNSSNQNQQVIDIKNHLTNPAVDGSYNNDITKLQNEIEQLKSENFNIKAIAALDKAGCLNSALAVKDIPADCNDISKWVENFKNDNEYLFQKQPQNHSTTFKPAQFKTLSTNEIMNNFIRGIY